MKNAGPIIGFILLAFCLYAIFTAPEDAADFVRQIFNGLAVGLASIGRFFNGLMR